MPIYEYECPDCNKQFEELVFDPDETPKCPACGGEKAVRLISQVNTRGDVSVEIPDFKKALGDKYGAGGPGGGCGSGGCGSGGFS